MLLVGLLLELRGELYDLPSVALVASLHNVLLSIMWSQSVFDNCFAFFLFGNLARASPKGVDAGLGSWFGLIWYLTSTVLTRHAQPAAWSGTTTSE